MKGYHLIFQYEVGINAKSIPEALAKGEEQAEIIRDAIEKTMPILKKVLVALKRPT